MQVAMIAAMSANRVIGVDNDLPWRLSSDLKYFKATTMGKPIIMGRKTYESVGKPLPGRPNIVVSRSWQAPEGVYSVTSIEAALELAKSLIAEQGLETDEIMVTGGAQIYQLALPLADKIYLTEVDCEVSGDALFPELNNDEWQPTSREEHSADEKNQYPFAFVVYEKKP